MLFFSFTRLFSHNSCFLFHLSQRLFLVSPHTTADCCFSSDIECFHISPDYICSLTSPQKQMLFSRQVLFLFFFWQEDKFLNYQTTDIDLRTTINGFCQMRKSSSHYVGGKGICYLEISEKIVVVWREVNRSYFLGRNNLWICI